MMKKITILLPAIMLFACSKPNKQTLPVEEIKMEDTITTVQEDTTIYLDIADVVSTPYLKDPLKYFRENNKFKDWDKKDTQKVLIGFVSEKDGSTSYVKVKKSCGIEKLDNEALRLIRDLKYDEPAMNSSGKPIRAGNMVIFVSFPPQ